MSAIVLSSSFNALLLLAVVALVVSRRRLVKNNVLLPRGYRELLGRHLPYRWMRSLKRLMTPKRPERFWTVPLVIHGQTVYFHRFTSEAQAIEFIRRMNEVLKTGSANGRCDEAAHYDVMEPISLPHRSLILL